MQVFEVSEARDDGKGRTSLWNAPRIDIDNLTQTLYSDNDGSDGNKNRNLALDEKPRRN